VKIQTLFGIIFFSYKTNWLQFLFVIKATALKQQIFKFNA